MTQTKPFRRSFFKVFQSLSSYKPDKGAFTTWLYRITTNYCLNWRRKKRFSFVPLEWIRRSDEPRASSFPGGQDEDEALRSALERMSDKLRAVIVLRYYGELSYSEIAECLNIPIGTVKSRLDLGLRTLQRNLALPALDGISDKKEELIA